MYIYPGESIGQAADGGFNGGTVGCHCKACTYPSLSESYVRDQDDDAPGRQPGPAGPRPVSMNRRGADLGYWMGEPQPTAPFEVIGGFEFDRTTVRNGPPQDKLMRVARHILASFGTPQPIRSVRLIGHTDPVGTPAYNLDLGRRRAIAVRQGLIATLERMRPCQKQGTRPCPSLEVRSEVDSAGETRPVATGQSEPERARNRRVEVFLPSAAQPVPSCRYDVRNALAIEREAVGQTLALSAQVANRFIRTVGAVGARGRFIPTVIDNKYWFAKLYEYITYYEIAEASSFRHPAFVLHFIPIFYELYYRALENWTAGNRSAVSSLWTTHFTRAGRPDNSSIRSWMDGVRVSIVTGVTAHVQGDMATALERAYRSYVAKYCLSRPPPFDEFRPDFFERNRVVFDRAKAAFFLHLSQFSPFPVSPEWGQFLFAKGEPLAGGLDVDEVYRWRDAAWGEARRRLGQAPPGP